MTGISEREPDSWRPTLVATDLDGTLVRSDGTVSERTMAALARLREHGALHVIVTGRSVHGCADVVETLGYEGLLVALQGAQVYDLGTSRLLTSVTLDRALARVVVERVRRGLGERAKFAALTADLPSRALLTQGFANGLFRVIETAPVRDIEEMLREPIAKMYVQHPDYTDDELTAALDRLCGDIVNPVLAGTGLTEILPAGMSKAIGLSLAARRLGVKAADTAAFGDMPNDIAMLRWAHVGIAVSNAHASVHAIADETVPSNDEDGVATMLERWFAGS